MQNYTLCEKTVRLTVGAIGGARTLFYRCQKTLEKSSHKSTECQSLSISAVSKRRILA